MTVWEYLNRREQRKVGLPGRSRTRHTARGFWSTFMSLQTARFVLALLSLVAATGITFWLMTQRIEDDTKDVVVFAVGQMFALTAMAFGYYYGSTARNDARPVDAHIVNASSDPVPTKEEVE